MGLDISVLRIVRREKWKSNWLGHNYIELYDEDKLDHPYCNPYPLWAKNFEEDKELEFYNWNEYKKQNGLDIVNDFHPVGYIDSKMIFETNNPVKLMPNGKGTISINPDDVPKINIIVKVLYYNEVGYQRKGLDQRFYDDYLAGIYHFYEWKKETLEKIRDECCHDAINGREEFQHNIIDKFIEGRDVVEFNW